MKSHRSNIHEKQTMHTKMAMATLITTMATHTITMATHTTTMATHTTTMATHTTTMATHTTTMATRMTKPNVQQHLKLSNEHRRNKSIAYQYQQKPCFQPC
jgi:hypothetical protein